MARRNKPVRHIYTDGSCHWHKNPNHNHGGWAFVALTTSNGDESNVYRSGYCEPPQTNNTMELHAVLEALRWVKREKLRQHPVVIYSDSMYVIGGMQSAFRHQVSEGLIDPPNKHYWKLLHRHAEACRYLRFVHVKGHRGDVWNEMCDVLANKARRDGMK